MVKIIKIERCSDCKWWEWDLCYHPDCDEREITINTSELGVFPYWCPLEEEKK